MIITITAVHIILGLMVVVSNVGWVVAYKRKSVGQCTEEVVWNKS